MVANRTSFLFGLASMNWRLKEIKLASKTKYEEIRREKGRQKGLSQGKSARS